MIRIASPVEGIAVERDPHEDAWQLAVSGRTFRLRSWTWGDRRRIFECATAGGAFDRAVFLEALFASLVDPVPDLPDPEALACACLCLLGARDEPSPTTLRQAEYLAVRTFGWRPSELDTEPAAAVDRLVEQIEEPAGRAAARVPVEDGWTRIVLADPPRPDRPAAAPPARLDTLLAHMARAAEAEEREPPARLPGASAVEAPDSPSRRAEPAATASPGSRSPAAAAAAEALPGAGAPAASPPPPGGADGGKVGRDEPAPAAPERDFQPTFQGVARFPRRGPRDLGRTSREVDGKAGLLVGAGLGGSLGVGDPPARERPSAFQGGSPTLPTPQTRPDTKPEPREAAGTAWPTASEAVPAVPEKEPVAQRLMSLPSPPGATPLPAARAISPDPPNPLIADGRRTAWGAATAAAPRRVAVERLPAARVQVRRPMEVRQPLGEGGREAAWETGALDRPGETPEGLGAAARGLDGFALSELEEQLADVLDRAVREAGIDLP